MILSCHKAMIEKKRTNSPSSDVDFSGGVIEKRHENTILIERKKKEESFKSEKIGMYFIVLLLVGSLIFLFLIRRSIENLHQDLLNGIIH